MSINRQQDQKYLNIDQQNKLGYDLEALAKTQPIKDTILFEHSTTISAVPALTVYLMAWRAGFRGYGLSKFGKARLVTIFSGLIFPANGLLAHEHLAHALLTTPFRPENPWSYGVRYALCQQVGIIPSLVGGLTLTFLFATRSGTLPLPDGMHKKGVREIATKLFFGKIKPYSKSLAVATVGSTVFMFFIGVGAYLQSRNLLNKMGRKTLSQIED